MGENIPRWLHADDIGCGTCQYIALVSIGSKLTSLTPRNNGGAGETSMIAFMLRFRLKKILSLTHLQQQHSPLQYAEALASHLYLGVKRASSCPWLDFSRLASSLKRCSMMSSMESRRLPHDVVDYGIVVGLDGDPFEALALHLNRHRKVLRFDLGVPPPTPDCIASRRVSIDILV
ncbi:hypothetical protein GW17_00028551 [Ensete ventricosum]|nr:hypothetical protein GW17_00028551 [Ensete ventricosum]